MPRNTDIEETLHTLQLFESHKKTIIATARALYDHHKSFDIVLGFRHPPPHSSSPSSPPTTATSPQSQSCSTDLYAAILVEFVEPQGTRWILRGEEKPGIGEAVQSLQQMLGQTALMWMARCRGGGGGAKGKVQPQQTHQKAVSEVEERQVEGGEEEERDEER